MIFSSKRLRRVRKNGRAKFKSKTSPFKKNLDEQGFHYQTKRAF